MTRIMGLLCALLLSGLALPAWAQGQFRVLVVAIPEQYHHDYTVVARPQFERMAQRHDFDMDWRWSTAPFDGDLSRYQAIVLLNTPGDALAGAQRAALEAYVRAGGGVVAVHRALVADRPGDWPWFERLIGRRFRIHPMVQSAVVRVEDRGFPAAFALPERWIWSDEWYEFEPPLIDGLRTVLRVDESSYDPSRIWPGQHAAGMGADHPVAWYHVYDGGRVFVTALGHPPAAYDDALYLAHLYGGLWWAATGRGLAEDVAEPAPAR